MTKGAGAEKVRKEGRAVAKRKPSLEEVTWMRGAAMGVVVLLHVLGYAVAVVPGAGGDPFLPMASVASLRFARQIFMVITGFVLTYQYWGRTVEPGPFLNRRVQSVVVPYLVWSAIYLTVLPALGGATGIDVWNPWAVIEALLTGGAMYHLYYIVLTLQFYLLFPWWIRWFQSLAPKRRQGWTIFLAAAGLVLLYVDFHWTLQYTSSAKWFLYRDRFLAYYFVYFLFGSALGAAVALADPGRRLSRRSVWLGWITAVIAALYVGTVFVVRLKSGWSYAGAVNIMQPSYVFYGIAVSMALYLTGRWKREHGRERGWVHAVGRFSFGIYLSHPLILFLLEQNLFASSSHRFWWAETALLWAMTMVLSWLLMAGTHRVPVLGWLLGSGQKSPWRGRAVPAGRSLSS